MRIYYLAIVILIVISGSHVFAEADALTSKELIGGANGFNGNIVTYKGEVVAAVMKRSGGSWVNLGDGYNAIGVWCDSGSLNDVGVPGDYKNEGDVLEVTGEFHRACPAHGGELDIHADSVRIDARGYPIAERVSMRRIGAAIVFFILTLLAVFTLRRRL